MDIKTVLETVAAKPDIVSSSWQALRGSAAQGVHWLALVQAYSSHDLPWQAGYAARQAMRCGAAAALDVLDFHWQDAGAGDEQLGRSVLPQVSALIERFGLVVKDWPGDWLTWLYLTRLLAIQMDSTANPTIQNARAPTSSQALEQARSLEVVPGETLHWLGVWRLNAGEIAGAVSALSGLVDVRPVRFGSMMYLGKALLRGGKVAAAEKAFSRASLSSNPDFLQDLAQSVYSQNYWQEAIEILKKALTIRPRSVALWLALARIEWEVYSLADCRESLRRVRQIEPDNPDAKLLNANMIGRMGDARGHFAIMQAAYADGADPLSRLASSMAMTSLYHDALSADAVADLHREVCAPIEAAFKPATVFDNPKTSGRRLRIGYVSGDFHRQHPVNIFMLPVLLRHDHDQCEIFVYHTGTMHDEYTRQAMDAADHWLEVATLDDAALQCAIVADGIDVLVDLAGHTTTHRLGLFAMRAAPIQATFLGYPHSTGLSTIDWIIGDATVTPSAHSHLYTEGLAQLPASVFCWAPVDAYPLPTARGSDATVVFGSFNNVMKLSPRTIGLWAEVLKAVPASQLLLKAPALRDEAVQLRFVELFAEQGVAPDRLLLRGPSRLADMMQEYGDLDIALDTVPYNGGTTTLQALWMGVPVITLAGTNFVSRMGASFLDTLDQSDWIAKDADDFVAKAVSLAENCSVLRQDRAKLRARMVASPLCDIQTYVAHLEALYRRMWQLYCEDGSQQVIRPLDVLPALKNGNSYR